MVIFVLHSPPKHQSQLQQTTFSNLNVVSSIKIRLDMSCYLSTGIMSSLIEIQTVSVSDPEGVLLLPVFKYPMKMK